MREWKNVETIVTIDSAGVNRTTFVHPRPTVCEVNAILPEEIKATAASIVAVYEINTPFAEASWERGDAVRCAELAIEWALGRKP